MVILLIVMIFCAYLYFLNFQELKKEMCYIESAKLWDTVNIDYPEGMSLQEVYEKNNRQSCASMYYIACVNGGTLTCASIKGEANYNY